MSRLNHDFHRYNLRGDGASEPEATSSWNDWAYFTIGSVPSSCHRHPIDLPQTTASASTHSSCQRAFHPSSFIRSLTLVDRMIIAWHRSHEASKRLDAIPGVGPVLATALIASIADPKAFRSGRSFSAWIGLVPKQHSSGGKDRLGSISKQGDRYLRSLFMAGALAVIRYAKIHGSRHRPWLTALLARRPSKVAAIALANKIARVVWAMMGQGERYKEPVAFAA